jgi:hypothetical protein
MTLPPKKTLKPNTVALAANELQIQNARQPLALNAAAEIKWDSARPVGSSDTGYIRSLT